MNYFFPIIGITNITNVPEREIEDVEYEDISDVNIEENNSNKLIKENNE